MFKIASLAAMKFNNRLQMLMEKHFNLCGRLNKSQKLYYFGALFAALSGIGWFIPVKGVFLVAVAIWMVLWCAAVATDILAVYQKVWDTILGKAVLLLVYALLTNFAYAIASQMVNDIVQYQSASLVYAINYVAVMLTPLFIFVSTYLTFLALLICSQIYWFFAIATELIRKHRYVAGVIPETVVNFPKATFAVRTLAFVMILSAAWGFRPYIAPRYYDFLKSSTASFIYNFEASRYSRCQLPANAKAIPVIESEIVIVEKNNDDYSFKAVKCIPILK